MPSIAIKKLFQLSFWRSVFEVFIQTFKRFPISITFLILIVLLSMSVLHDVNIFSEHLIQIIFLLLIGGALIFFSGTLLAENLKWKSTSQYLILFFIFFIYCVYVYFHPAFNLEYIVLFFSIFISVSFAPGLFRPTDNYSSWYLNFQIIASLFFAVLAGLIFSGGLSLILTSVQYLFEIKINYRFYSDIWILGMLFIAPVYMLSQFPEQFDYQQDECQVPRGVNFIFSFVLIPLVLVYMLILYAYFIKILLQWQLPHGHLGAMISIFGIIGILTHLAVYPIHQMNRPLIAWFYRNFYRIMVIPVLLLAFAIGIRIHQYGVTEQRYLVALCTFWFSGLVIYFLYRKENFRLTSVTFSLSILLFLSALGPWSMESLSLSSQLNRFEQILKQNQLLKNGKIIVAVKQPDIVVAKELSSVTSYLLRSITAEQFRHYFTDQQAFNKALHCNNNQPCTSRNAVTVLELMGIEYIVPWSRQTTREINIQIKNFNYDKTLTAFDVKNSDFFIPLLWLNSGNKKSIISIDRNQQIVSFSILLNPDGHLEISSADYQTLSLDLNKIVSRFELDTNKNLKITESWKLQLFGENSDLGAKLYLSRITIRNPAKKTDFSNINGNLLIKIKD